MDITDFSRGIVTDVDAQDGDTSTTRAVSDMVNFDIYDGHLRARRGFEASPIPLYTHDYDALSDHTDWVGQLTPAGSFPDPDDEEIIQHVIVRAPLAATDSVKDFTSPYEWCFNKNVTIFLVRYTGANPGFRLYGDFHFEGKFERLDWGATEFQKSPNAEDPFMVVTGGSVMIGGVQSLVDSRDGVLWLGHIKRLGGFAVTAVGPPRSYDWLAYIDEWRLTDSEVYDSYGDVTVQAAITSFETLYTQQRTTTGALALLGASLTPPQSVKTILQKGVSPWLLGGDTKRRFNVMVTAMYDGYHESRPLRWDPAFYKTITTSSVIFGETWGVGMAGSQEYLPASWNIKRDQLGNQYLRVEIDDYKPRSNLMGWGLYPEQGADAGKRLVEWRMTWNNLWREDSNVEDTGDGFEIVIIFRDGMDADGWEVRYDWQVRNNLTVGLALRIDTDGSGANNDDRWPYLLWLLGGPDPFPGDKPPGNRELMHVYGSYMRCKATPKLVEDRNQCKKFWSITNIAYSTVSPHVLPVDPWARIDIVPAAGYEIPPASSEPQPTPLANPTTRAFLFQLVERTGVGMLAILPSFPDWVLAEPSGSADPSLVRPARRLSGFRMYVKEDDVDVDYRMIREISLDYAEHSKDHGGYGDEDTKTFLTHRDPPITGKCATWMIDSVSGRVVPNMKLVDDYASPLRGGINRSFIICDQDLTDAEGKSMLSANLLRDFTKSDRPNWKRGAVCEGRLFGLSMADNDLQYSIMAAGITQWCVMPGSFPISKGEKLTHIISWRGQHHMVFTDENLWRIDLADGDEFSWRVMDSFAKKGTTLWRTIVDTPAGMAYASMHGVFLYDGNRPVNIIKSRWHRHYLEDLAGGLTEANTFAHYNGITEELWLSLNMNDGEPPNPFTWIFSFEDKHWRKYRFPYALGLRYMAQMDGRWHVMVPGSGWKRHALASYVDEHDGTSVPYGVHLVTHELPPPSQLGTPYWQYIGIRYEANVTPAAMLSVLTSAYSDGRHPAVKIHLPAARHEQMYPLPMGIGRGMRIVFSQGEYMGVTNMPNGITLSGFSLRGTDMEQWSYSR